MSVPIESERDFDLRSILIITFFAHLLVHTYMVVFPVLMPLIQEEFSVSYTILGAIFTASNLAFGVGAIVAGLLADRLGSKWLISICAIGMGSVSLITGLSTTLEGLTISLFLLGLFASFYHPASFSLISKGTKERGRAFGVHGVGGSIGLAVAPLVAMPVALEWGWRMAFIVLAIPGIMVGIATIVSRIGVEVPTSMAPLKAFKSLMTSGFIITLVIYACYGLTFQGVIGFLPSYLSEIGGLVVGGILASTVTLAMGAPGQLVGGFLTDRQGSTHFLALAFTFLALALVLLRLLPPEAGILVAFVAGFLVFSTQPATGTLLAENSSVDVRGIAYGLAFMANFGVGSFGTSLAGLVADATGDLANVFPAMVSFILIALAFVFLLERHWSRPT